MVRIIFQQNNISSLKMYLIFWPLLELLQGDKEFFMTSIPKFFSYSCTSSTVYSNLYQHIQIHQGEASQL